MDERSCSIYLQRANRLMTSDGKRGKSLIEEQVFRHLEQNPDFLTQHPSLLELIQLKHGSGQATSLIEQRDTNTAEAARDVHAAGSCRDIDDLTLNEDGST